MNQDDGNVGNGFITARGECRSKVCRIVVRTTKGASLLRAGVLFTPLLQGANTQIISIVEQQFVEARFCYSDQLNLHLARSGGGHIPFSDVLFARAGSLYHLVDGAITSLQKNGEQNDRSHHRCTLLFDRLTTFHNSLFAPKNPFRPFCNFFFLTNIGEIRYLCNNFVGCFVFE